MPGLLAPGMAWPTACILLGSTAPARRRLAGSVKASSLYFGIADPDSWPHQHPSSNIPGVSWLSVCLVGGLEASRHQLSFWRSAQTNPAVWEMRARVRDSRKTVPGSHGPGQAPRIGVAQPPSRHARSGRGWLGWSRATAGKEQIGGLLFPGNVAVGREGSGTNAEYIKLCAEYCAGRMA